MSVAKIRCGGCKKEVRSWSSLGSFYFFYNDIRFDTCSTKTKCTRCAEKESKERFDKYGKYLIEFSRFKEIEIDWIQYLEQLHCAGETHFREINQVFMEIGIFSTNPVCHWEIIIPVSNGFYDLCNPLAQTLYFTRRKYVEGFARTLLKNAPGIMKNAKIRKTAFAMSVVDL